jgi:hypothetical protein
MKSIFNGQGYFRNDDRASGGKLDEDDLVGCRHCHKPMKKRTWRDAGGWRCYVCDAPLCQRCGQEPAQLRCAGPFELQLERALRDLHRREQNAKILSI